METEERIKTNIIKLSKLYKTPCKKWLKRFVDGKIDAHDAFKKYGEQYTWLYKNSPYDLIGWEIKNDCFDWVKHSWLVARHCQQYVDKEKYNWIEQSWAVAKFCSQYMDKDRYNWERHTWAVRLYCPKYLIQNPKQ